MYTDETCCAPCYDTGLFTDGENYCAQCRNYLCLKCAKSHGQMCRNRCQVNKNTVRHSSSSDYQKPPKITCVNKPYGNIPDNYDRRLKSENKFENQVSHYTDFETAPSSAGLDDDHKKSVDFRSETVRIKLNRKENNIYRDGTVEVHDETKQISSDKTADTRQKYSARGGIVRVTKFTTDVTKVKLQRCSDHPEMPIENFCNIHNDLCCEDCLNLGHRKCIVQSVDEVAHGILSSGEVQQAEQKFGHLIEKCNTVAKKYEKHIDTMRISGTSINNEKTEEKGADANLADTDKEPSLKRMHTKCVELKENILLCISEIQNVKESGREILTFITLKKNKKTFSKIKAKLQELIETYDKLVTDRERDFKQTTESTETQTTSRDFHRESLTSKTDTTTGDSITIPAADEEGTENILPNKTVIGEVILHSFGEYDKDESAEDKRANNDDELGENEEIEFEEVKEATKSEQHRCKDIEAIHNQKSMKKNVGFAGGPVTSCLFRKPFDDRVKTYGLVTEYYLNNIDDDLDGIRVLRLQSAPPERQACRSKEIAQRPTSMHITESRKMAQWQNRKILESVEHGKESNELSEILPHTVIKQDDKSREYRKKKVAESNKAEAKDKIKTKQQDEAMRRKQLIRSRRENASFPHRKLPLLKKNAKKFASKSMVRNYEARTEEQRLKRWIKQTEAINEKNRKGNSRISTNYAENEMKEADEVDKVYAANVNDEFDDFNDDQESRIIPMMTKEATHIKMVNPNERHSSAKSRTSDSEESMYNSQTYVLRPKSQLLLTEEQIIRLPEDERLCETNSISCLPDGRIIVSDFSNMAIKMFRVGWGKASVLALGEPPHDVSVVSNSILAVISGLAYDRLLIVSVGQCLSIKRHLKTDCVCKAISSYQSHIYLLCLYRYKTEIRILTIDGVVSIRLDLGHAIPSPHSIAVKASNGLIYVADKNRGILTVDMRKIVTQSFDKNIESYVGVETDINNNVFVCTKDPYGIYELSYDGKHLMPILLGYGVDNVKAIAYNAASNSLVVGCANSETIQIYKIHDTVSLKKNARH